MCGRFFLKLYGQLREAFGVPDEPAVERYNIAPGQTVPVVVQAEAGRRVTIMRWGLIPSWAKDAGIGFKTINARADSVAEKPSFRAAFKKRHCLVPASGFYEWKAIGKKKLPTLFQPREGLAVTSYRFQCDECLIVFDLAPAPPSEWLEPMPEDTECGTPTELKRCPWCGSGDVKMMHDLPEIIQAPTISGTSAPSS